MKTLSGISRVPSLALSVLVLLALVIAAAGAAQAQVIYDSTVSPLPANLPSLGAQATQSSEFGDGVTFVGTSRKLSKVTVTLSSWACESGAWYLGNCTTTPGATFTIPITLNIYSAGSPSPGSLILTRTQTFKVPYRPSADPACLDADLGKWRSVLDGLCYSGRAKNITFNFDLPVLPDSIVFGIVYNTTSYGPNPIGTSAPCFSTPQGCPYDSLNIALAPVVDIGSQTFPGMAYWNTSNSSNYCDVGAAGIGVFRLDSPGYPTCWEGYVPAVQFYADTHRGKPHHDDDRDDHQVHRDQHGRGDNDRDDRDRGDRDRNDQRNRRGRR